MILSAGHSCGVTYVIAIKRGVPISLNILRQNMLNVKLSLRYKHEFNDCLQVYHMHRMSQSVRLSMDIVLISETDCCVLMYS